MLDMGVHLQIKTEMFKTDLSVNNNLKLITDRYLQEKTAVGLNLHTQKRSLAVCSIGL